MFAQEGEGAEERGTPAGAPPATPWSCKPPAFFLRRCPLGISPCSPPPLGNSFPSLCAAACLRGEGGEEKPEPPAMWRRSSGCCPTAAMPLRPSSALLPRRRSHGGKAKSIASPPVERKGRRRRGGGTSRRAAAPSCTAAPGVSFPLAAAAAMNQRRRGDRGRRTGGDEEGKGRCGGEAWAAALLPCFPILMSVAAHGELSLSLCTARERRGEEVGRSFAALCFTEEAARSVVAAAVRGHEEGMEPDLSPSKEEAAHGSCCRGLRRGRRPPRAVPRCRACPRHLIAASPCLLPRRDLRRVHRFITMCEDPSCDD